MEHYDWNDGWLFAPTFDPAIVRPECTGVELEPVRLPHTVKTLPYNYCNENEYQRVSGYRREFFAPKEWQGRTVLLTFGAVAHDATVFCNGRRVFHHGCGYTAFTVDLTESLLLGQKNVVAVRCDSREDLNIPPFGGQIDFLTYGGIYRAVSLDVKEPAYLRDIFIEAQAEGDFRIYSSTVGETIGCTLQAEIRSPAGSRALYSGELSLPIVGTLNGVHPWSVEHPFLYTLTVRLIRPGTSGLPDRVLDEKSTRFGFRTIQFVAGGFYLNGQRVELREIRDGDAPLFEEPAFAEPAHEALYAALGDLPEKCRIVVHLFYFEDMGTRRIAEVLGIKEPTVRTRLVRARKLLKQSLKEAWEDEQPEPVQSHDGRDPCLC